MNRHLLYDHSITYMKKLCSDISERCVGSEGNRKATTYFQKVVSSFGWKITIQEFEAIDWYDGGATLKADNDEFNVLVSPYSLPFSGSAQLAAASTFSELDSTLCAQIGEQKLSNRIITKIGIGILQSLFKSEYIFCSIFSE